METSNNRAVNQTFGTWKVKDSQFPTELFKDLDTHNKSKKEAECFAKLILQTKDQAMYCFHKKAITNLVPV